MTEVTTNLCGGLGNRLFQVAALMGYVAVTPGTIPVICDRFLNPYNAGQHGDHTYLLRSLRHSTTYHWLCYNEPTGHFFSTFPAFPQNQSIAFIGFWQCEQYFKHIETAIRTEFGCPPSVAESLLTKYPLLPDAFFLHIRRGDFVNNQELAIDLTSYYAKCIESTHDAHIYILSDDMTWCEQCPWIVALPSKTYVYENEVLSLWLMSLCGKGGICANSTFSWWGGWLGCPTRTIYYPDRIVRSTTDTGDHIPSWFIKIATSMDP
jgi:hypothetical protein